MTTWMDVTDLVRWRGPLTGIRRVQVELGARLVADGGRLVHFDRAAGRFRQLDDRMVSRILDTDRSAITAGMDAPIARRARRWGAATTHRLGHAARRVTLRPLLTLRPVNWLTGGFRRGDQLVVVGLQWRTPGMTAELERLRARRGIRVGLFVHDVLPVTHPHVNPADMVDSFGPAIGRAVAAADVVLVISDATAAELRGLGVVGAVQPIRLVRMAAEPPGAAEVEPVQLGLGDRPFVVAVGWFLPRKNYVLLYQTYRLAAERGIELPVLVIAGRLPPHPDELYRMIRTDPVVAGRIVIASDVDDAGRRWLYRHCRFAAMVSVAEGWGLPISEALAYGKTCVASDIPTSHEAGGDAVVYTSPFDSGACLARFVELLDDTRRAELERRIAARVPVTWDDSYADLRAALGSAPSSGSAG